MSRTRWVGVVVVVAGLVAAGCQTGVRAGSRCRGSGWGDDGTYVLKCERGRWVRKMNKAQAAELMLALLKSKLGTTTTTTTTTSSPPATALETTTTTSSTTTTTAAPPPPFWPAELVSSGPGDSTDTRGQSPFVSDDGRYVAFTRPGVCGPLVRDRVAGTTATVVPQATPCPVESLRGMSADGSRLLVRYRDDCGAGSMSFDWATLVYAVVDRQSGQVRTPVPCNDPDYTSPPWGSPMPQSSSAPQPTSSTRRMDSAVLSGDGGSLLIARQLTTMNHGLLPPSVPCSYNPCYGTVSLRIQLLVERVPVAGGPRTPVVTLLDTGVVPASTTIYGDSPYLLQRGPVELVGADEDGSIVALNSPYALQSTPADTNARPDGYVAAAGSVQLVAAATTGTSVRALSRTGDFAVFTTAAALDPLDTNGLLDAYLFSRVGAGTERVSVGTGAAQATLGVNTGSAGVSADGRWVAFQVAGQALGCTNPDTVAFVRDRTTGRTHAPLRRADGEPATSETSWFSFDGSGGLALSADGSTLAGTSVEWLGDPADAPAGTGVVRTWAVKAAPPGPSTPDC